ncbi:hypothetical protein RHSIM_Rhsim05G0025900 [Rhododendron simsii]|uniref:Pentatricopeptide repeat-containing protein n=1 Tax=Rhododendron simsii TaxID=118357 RepID=A0A834GWL2_RHOSS|nr:hypothetical protein RHSIM_Rhsim05G0025900 [Rhododendron simsii]
MRYPPPGYYKDLVFPTRFLIPIRFNYSFAASCDVESNPEALIVIQRKQGKAVHGHVIKYGINPDAHLWFSSVDFIPSVGVCGSQVLDDMPKRDVVSWTALIAGLITDGYSRDGLSFYCDMRKDGVKPDGFTLATVLKDCSMCTEIGFGEQVHVEVIKIGFLVDISVGSSLVDLYAKCSEMEFANGAFLSMPEWIMQYLGVHCLMGMLGWVKEKKRCSNSGKLRETQSMHSTLIKVGVELDQYVFLCLYYDCMVNIFCRAGKFDHDVQNFIEEMKLAREGNQGRA